MSKIIAIDLDGTLLTNDKIITDYSVKLLNELSNDGHLIVLTSGRSYEGIVDYHKQLNLNTPIISYNGALITFSNKASIEVTLNTDEVHNLYIDLKPILKSLMLNTKTTMYSYNHDLKAEYIFYGAYFNNVKEIDVNNKINYISGIIVVDEKDKNGVKEYFKDKNIKTRYYGEFGNESYFDIHTENISKASGIKKVIEHLDINKKLISFGDGINDIEMIQNSDIGVVMTNAKQQLKAVAKYFTDYDNNNDGVVKHLNKILKKREF